MTFHNNAQKNKGTAFKLLFQWTLKGKGLPLKASGFPFMTIGLRLCIEV